MAAVRTSSQILRSLARELKSIYGQVNQLFAQACPGMDRHKSQLKLIEKMVKHFGCLSVEQKLRFLATTIDLFFITEKAYLDWTYQKSMLPLRPLKKYLMHIKNNMTEVPAYAYLRDQMQQYEVTDQKICRAHKEMEHVASTYLCYLESLRKQEELLAQYKGRGERSVEESAAIVGLKLPLSYKENSPDKTPDK